jgi:hypothetical protein
MLRLFSNQLSGTVPSELSDLGALWQLYLHENQLSGTIPLWLSDMSSLRGLALNSNQFTGTIPSELGSLLNLQGLYLSSNQLTGRVPPELGNLVDLRELWLRHTGLWGALPMELTNIPFMDHFFFEDTRLCEPADPVFQAWLATIPIKSSTGVVCVPPTGLTITGPITGTVDISETFTATVTPISATLPISYFWAASGQAPVTHPDWPSTSNSVSFTWTVTGTQAISLTARNIGGEVTATHSITVEAPPALNLGISGSDLEMGWDPIEGAVEYRIYRGTDPYFTPSGDTLHDVSYGLVYTDTGALDDGVNYYYIVTAVDDLGGETAPFNDGGVFSFGLEPGG